jgi:hypothetical protein
MPRSRLDPQAWRALSPSLTSLAVGATLACPETFPDGFGISRRDEDINRFLGLVMTRPDEDTFVMGLNYFDSVDGFDNEDMYKVTPTTSELVPYMRGTFEKEYPEYAGHHWASKPFLRRPADS